MAYIRLKLATLTFKALHTGRPPYLSNLLQHVTGNGDTMRKILNRENESSLHFIAKLNSRIRAGKLDAFSDSCSTRLTRG